ncbi:SDR family NAD(P)-dependent oxidoreductase [Rhodococcus wratislaviensis]|uniref:Putative oxidoreductase n=1 Tax=Rhodococcus wratislaviensis NBRC 100605 TaxID=1219028 RepID=X0Q2W8_RHOWR|nr:glucose 1-dehydrogenase [Rhodococcus wratislaviensis]GAF44706.1 putative oxidoreductase [Rhodococcus wratislaviensis NBRC 100605]
MPEYTVDATPFAGKVALVTGGSRGLGREMAWAFARSGADVAIVSRKLDACVSLAKEIEADTGRHAVGFSCHMGEWNAQEQLADLVYAEFGRLDILVNNAGIAPVYPSLPEVTESLYDKVFDVNVKGAFRLMSVVAPRMAAADGGSIINISSIATKRPMPSELPYAAAKSALEIMTMGFAQEYGPAVRVNAILPGAFDTDIAAAWDPEVVANEMAHLPAGRIGRPNEIVGAALYLAGPSASYTTGVLLPVDGGRTAMGR